MSIVTSLASLVSFVVGIIVLIKLFQKEGLVKAILGFICMLYTYIWGWQHAKEQNITNLMWVWTAVIVLSIVVAIFFGGAAPQSSAILRPMAWFIGLGTG